MDQFAKLFDVIENTNSTKVKVQALADYFSIAEDRDKIWMIAIFSHKRPKRSITSTQLRVWAAEYANLPLWLFEETYHIVGDLAETISKIIPLANSKSNKTLHEWIEYLISIKELEENDKKQSIINAWSSLDQNSRFIFNKLLTGGFRMGVSQKTIVKALSKHLDQEENVIAHKLMGNWSPLDTTFEELLIKDDPNQNLSKPYPFYLAYALDVDIESLGSPDEWFAEYKWDGIRGQLIKRGRQVFLWSRGEELITNQFPEFTAFENLDIDFVIDGEILVAPNKEIGSFNELQKRIGRKNVSKKMLNEYPAIIKAYDITEIEGKDIRHESQISRRQKLESLFENFPNDLPIKLSELISYTQWDELIKIRAEARGAKSEGIMLKRKSGVYKTGRKKGDWFKWKVDPMTIDAVMIYAQRGHGRRANLFTDFTFALKDGDKLVPFTKAYSGLTDEEFKEITRFVKSNTLERFGPVCSVKAALVFEIAFEGIAESKRHKSGIALRFPRMKRWRKDKVVEEINTLDDIKKFLI